MIWIRRMNDIQKHHRIRCEKAKQQIGTSEHGIGYDIRDNDLDRAGDSQKQTLG